MSLTSLLRLKKRIEKPKFIDEDLTPEEINKKIRVMDLVEIKEYVSKLSDNKKIEVLVYTTSKFSKYTEKMNKQCIKEQGKNLMDYHDIHFLD